MTWYDIPSSLPAHGQLCSVRRIAYYANPFFATWSLSSAQFTESSSGLILPWYQSSRWAPSDTPAPSTILIATGSTNPDRSGTYTQRGIVQSQPFYQRANDQMFLFWWPSLAAWVLYAYLGNPGPSRHSTEGNADPSIITGNYNPQGTCTGTAVLAYPS